MKNVVEGPWCRRVPGGYRRFLDVWILVGSKHESRFACNDFWQYFEWKRPKKNQEMRLVGSRTYVRGAQKTLIRNDLFGRRVVLGSRLGIAIYPPLERLLQKIEPRVLFEFYVWWWPEYRAKDDGRNRTEEG